MAVTLVGEIVNSCDATTGFTNGNISGDDDFVEGTGAIGLKISAGTNDMVTTTLGASAPYDLSVGGTEEDYHIIMWFNTKTPINATTGLQIRVGDGTDTGDWNVMPVGFYKGGFITQAIGPGNRFDAVAGGTWTTGNNPAQLTAISEIGAQFTTTTSIMGSFNNCQIDQITIGLGARVDAGTTGTPNTFETVRVADEDTNYWGWWGSSNGAVVGKGKLFIGPATGSATSVFIDTAFAVIFADQRVDPDFYEINIDGVNTDVTWTLGTISAANSTPSRGRWNLTCDADANSFTATNCVLSGGGFFNLNDACSFIGTTFIDCFKLTSASAVFTDCTFLDGAENVGQAELVVNGLEEITNCRFDFSAGHAIEIDSIGTHDFDGNIFTGSFGGTPGSNLTSSSGSTTAMIYNNSGGLVTINVIGGGTTPSIRNGVGATTVVVNAVTVTVTALDATTSAAVSGARLSLEAASGGSLAGSLATTITTSGTTATATATAHGLTTGDKVVIRGANESELVGIFTVTVTGANTFTYTIVSIGGSPGTGTITTSAQILEGLTNASGVVTTSSFSFGTDQPVVGRIRRGTTSPLYKTSGIVGTITSAGFSATVSMIPDE